jgi:hypothetical protein
MSVWRHHHLEAVRPRHGALVFDRDRQIISIRWRRAIACSVA